MRAAILAMAAALHAADGGSGAPVTPTIVQAQTHTSGTNAFTTFNTGSYTVPAGLSKRVVLLISAHAGSASDVTLTASFAGTPMNIALKARNNFNTYALAELHVGDNTPSGIFSVVVSSSRRFNLISFTVLDSDAAVPLALSAVNAGDTNTFSATTAGDLLVSYFFDQGSSGDVPVVNAEQTQIATVWGNSTARHLAAGYRTAPGGDAVSTWTVPGTDSSTTHFQFALRGTST